MTMNDTPGAMAGFEQDPMQLPGQMAPRRLSIAALLSLISSLILCIPVVTQLLGILFGVIGVVIVVRNREERKGMGLAIAGISISVLVLVGYVVVSIMFGQTVKHFPNSTNQFVHNLQAGDIAKARTWMDSGVSQSVTDTELAALTDRLTTDYGQFQSANYDWEFQGYQLIDKPGMPSHFNNQVPLSLTLQFDHGSVHTLVVTKQNFNTANLDNMFLVEHIYFIPPNGKVWEFPATASTSSPSTPPSKAPDTNTNPPDNNTGSGGG